MAFIRLILSSIILFFPCAASAEIIQLKSGKVIEGKILERTNEHVVIDYNGTSLYYENKYIESIRPEEPQRVDLQDNIPVESSDFYLKQGLAKACEEKLDQAEQLFKKGAQVYPADRNFKGALGIFTDLGQGKISREYALSLFKGSYYLERKEFGQAISQLQQALNINPGDADVCYNLAVAYQNIDRSDLALKYLSKVLDADPLDPETYSFMATIYYSEGEYQKAQENFLLARELFKKKGVQDKAAEIDNILEEF